MEARSPFVVGRQPGFAPEVGGLVVMLSYARRTTEKAVEGLTVSQLDHLEDAESNSIGALLAHVAAIEVAYQCATFEQRRLSPAEQARWGAAMALGDRGRDEIRGQPLDHYVATLDEVRAHTLRELAARIYDFKMQKEHAKRSAERKSLVGSGDRSERIRTYNFPQNRVTDHRIGLTLHNLDQVIAGNLQPVTDALIDYDRQQLRDQMGGLD